MSPPVSLIFLDLLIFRVQSWVERGREGKVEFILLSILLSVLFRKTKSVDQSVNQSVDQSVDLRVDLSLARAISNQRDAETFPRFARAPARARVRTAPAVTAAGAYRP